MNPAPECGAIKPPKTDIYSEAPQFCWVCGESALTRFGVACSKCVVVVGQMVLEARY